MLKKFMTVLLLISTLTLTACQNQTPTERVESFDTWQAIVEQGRGKTVTILMWGGNDMINTYMDNTVANKLKADYAITLKRVPMNAPEFINKLLNEKEGKLAGSADLLWINAENFRTARQGGLIWGPITEQLANYNSVYNLEADDLNYDTGIAVEGMEAIWGRAQLVFTTDGAKVDTPPKSYAELLTWAKAHPGRFTYPKLPDDFAGSAFVRGAIYEITGERNIPGDLSREDFAKKFAPVLDYLAELHPYLWREGTAFPASQAQLDELFLNGEVDFTMGFELGKTAGQVTSGSYPSTAYSFVFDTGTIGNSHYLAVPFNAPEKAAALLVIDALQSPELQLEKFKPTVWGDIPAFDATKLTGAQKQQLADIEKTVFPTPLAELFERRLPEMSANYIDWVEAEWTSRFAK